MLAGAARAGDQYVLTWRGTVYTRNAAGQISARSFSEKDFINKAAQDNGIDPKQLVLVYRVDARDTAVAWAANGGFVADVLQLQYIFTDVPNATDTVVVRQAILNDVNDPAHENTPLGSAFGTEKARRSADGTLLSYSFKGNFQYAIPEAGTIYTGTFATGKVLKDTSGN